MKSLILRLLGYPPIGRFALKMMKKKVLKPFQIPLSEVVEKQERMLEEKFRRMEGTEIGKKLGVRKGISLQELTITDYGFYQPFYRNPSPSAFMYPLEQYERIKTSGTAGKEKWFLMPRGSIIKSVFETSVPALIISTHDGEKITLEYGDTLYINTAPRPFVLGTMVSVASGKSGRFPLVNIVPNLNLSFSDKVKYFIKNHEKIDAAVVQASILVSQIMPAIKKRVRLKSIFCPDTIIAEMYFDEIFNFVGVPPRTTYNSTETLNCTVPSIQHSLGFFFDWRRGFFEFTPLKDEEIKGDETVTVDEVEVGGIYHVIYTSFEGELTRYATYGAMKCIAKGDDVLGIDCPIFKFHTRLERNISLHNFTRISEDELITAFRESGIQFVEFTARKETESGLEYLAIYVETMEDLEVDKIQESLHKQLYNKDRDYRDLVDFYGYVPLKVHLVPKGVFAKYLINKVAAMSKVARIKMPEEEFKKFIQLVENIDVDRT